jgi:SAM-dependent methyltransferase
VYEENENGHSGSRMDLSRPLGDAPDRSYVRKLEQFARFAEPELKRVIADLPVASGMVALDLGCGAGLATRWLREALGDGFVVGVDLSLPHLQAARAHHAVLVQADGGRPSFRLRTVDLIWTCNTINHLRYPVEALRELRGLLKDGGRLAVAQSGLLPDLFFAWDAPLEDAVRAACHRAYRERYGLRIEDTAGVRGLVGVMRSAGFASVATRTYVVERVQPLGEAARAYLRHAIFEGAWGEKVLPYLSADERARLRRNCDPASPEFCLDRDDFHHVQTLTVCVARSDS